MSINRYLLNKYSILLKFSNGSYTYTLKNIKNNVFSYYYLKYHLSHKFSQFSLFFLFFLKKLIKINLIEYKPGDGIKYSRSLKSSSKIIQFNKNNYTSLILLPSKLKKIISIFSIVSFSNIDSFNPLRLNKAGFWKTKGYKQTVRGVAMNPVDHPHGGRTKSIKHQRTPWGKTTKLK